MPDPRIQHDIVRFILCPEKEAAGEAERQRYFGLPRLPGTSSIGERKRNAALFQDTADSAILSYDSWLDLAIDKTLNSIISKKILVFGRENSLEKRKQLVRNLKIMLEFQTSDGTALCNLIPADVRGCVYPHDK